MRTKTKSSRERKFEGATTRMDPHFSVGRTFFGERFQLVAPIGRGSFGIAWRAFDPKLQNQMLLNYLLDCAENNEDVIADLCLGSKHGIAANNPTIIRVFDLQTPSKAALVIKRILELPGTDPFFDVSEIRDFVRLLCQALRRFHNEEISEKNEPESTRTVFIKVESDENFEFEVSDRVTRTINRMTGATNVFSTSYGSPELALGGNLDEKQDVYAVGALIYDLLTGRPPFYQGEVMTQILQVVPPSMANRRREFGLKGELIPGHWEDAVAACLAKSPADRPDLNELMDRLFGETSLIPHRRKLDSREVNAAKPVSRKVDFGSLISRKLILFATGVVVLGSMLTIGGRLWPARGGSSTAAPVAVAVEPVPNPSEKMVSPKLAQLATKPPTHEKAAPASAPEKEPEPEKAPQIHLAGESPNRPADATLPDSPPIIDGKSFLNEDIGIEMIWIEALRSWVTKTEVTQAQFARGGGRGYKKYQGEERSRDSVSWNQAMKFCAELTAREKLNGNLPAGYAYTLPTEAQWKVYVGDAGLNHSVHGRKISQGPETPGTMPENQYGLVDVRGNLWEWMRDDFSPEKPARGKALRGGGFASTGSLLMDRNARNYGAPDTQYYEYGFRFVLTPETTGAGIFAGGGMEP